ncbi:hypothetical protein DS891_03485 [Pseudoalteromonas sp. JC28]|uniref:heme-binding protein n=1 Tax=Pseudoalteromonas sp. JC28 TaxID=2267617 RepID=UPI001572C6DD|nr:heme-binding protein [Pseudoalteromonas sp. JC28]NSY32664.1 hypothetical protein [Pseudoalteromonas sp. JC28]
MFNTVTNQQAKATADHLQAALQPNKQGFVPDYNIPLLATGGGNSQPETLSALGPLADLIGTWASARFAGFNVMPLPQETAPEGVILFNFPYYEVITFSATQGKVVNRGGDYQQNSYTIFYEQRVFFADGDKKDQLVHAENGTWLNLATTNQGSGKYNRPPYIPAPSGGANVPIQNPEHAIVKQVSIPHGNSILALGNHHFVDGRPEIPIANTLPQPETKAGTAIAGLYGENSPSNPNINPNIVLEQQLLVNQAYNPITKTDILTVNSDNDGLVSSIPFCKNHVDVPNFSTTYWIERLSSGASQLQYTQNISLQFNNTKNSKLLFPHITANTLFKVG